jgi:hypothetical protein
MEITYGSIEQSKQHVRNLITSARTANPNYRVIDIGGVAGGGWSNDLCDLIVDINADTTSQKALAVDICNPNDWLQLFAIVKQHGLFDYAICTHTLEDVYDPVLALQFLPKIAKAGIITMPSITTELSRPENPNWLGYIHHRWLFDQVDGELLIAPKLCFLESLVGDSVKFDPDRFEIQYSWRDILPYRQFMNNYLGPNATTVVARYKELINMERRGFFSDSIGSWLHRLLRKSRLGQRLVRLFR